MKKQVESEFKDELCREQDVAVYQRQYKLMLG